MLLLQEWQAGQKYNILHQQAMQSFYFLHFACWGHSPQSPVMQSKLCGCADKAGGCADGRASKKAVDLPNGAEALALSMQ